MRSFLKQLIMGFATVIMLKIVGFDWDQWQWWVLIFWMSIYLVFGRHLEQSAYGLVRKIEKHKLVRK